MPLPPALAVNIFADLALLGLLASVMSRAQRLSPPAANPHPGADSLGAAIPGTHRSRGDP
jgi:hypothetical protein